MNLLYVYLIAIGVLGLLFWIVWWLVFRYLPSGDGNDNPPDRDWDLWNKEMKIIIKEKENEM